MNNVSGSAAERLSGFSSEKMELLKLLIEQRSRRAREIRRYPRAVDAGSVRLPASWAQQRLWFIHQLEGGSGAYHIPLALRLRGSLDERALQQALDTLVQRHETLRTVFVGEDGDPMQEISQDGRLPLKAIDLSGWEEAERESQVRLHTQAEANGAFDLRKGPLIRTRLLRLQPREHVLLVTMHHIVSDGWSLGVFMRELAELYKAYHEGRGDPLPPLPIQYADYAQWQRDWLQGETLQKQLDYWRARLRSAPPELELPKDRPRPATRSYRGASVAFALNAELSAELRALAQRHEMTLFMVLYAAWAILVSRLSGQSDVVIGTPVANRQRPEVERLIGFLVNTLALRVEVQGEATMEQFLEQVREVTLGAYDHQDVPFEQVVEVVQPERTLNRHPLFQVMFALQNAARIELRLPGVTAAMEEDVFAYCKFDLVLSLEEQDDEIAGTLGYATDLFERETVERWLECYRTLLSDLTNGADRRVGDLRSLPDAERQRIESFNARPVPYPEEKLLHELFEQQVQRTPAALSVVYEEQSLTYAELNNRASQLAQYLQAKGVGPDRLVGLCIERGPQMIVGILAIWKAGGAYVPLDPDYPTERLAYMLEDAAPTVLLTQRRLRERLPPTTATVIAIDGDWPEMVPRIGRNLDPRSLGLRSHHLAYVIYTSGSTGQPKGVMVEHRQVASLWQSLEHLYRRSAPCQRIGVNASLNFDASVKQLIQVLSGRTLVVVPEHVRSDVPMLLRLIDEQRIDGIDCTPSQLRIWLDEGLLNSREHRLRVVLVGGEAIDAELWRQLAQCAETDFYNVYGPTESTVDTTAACLKGDTGPPHIGRPMENRQVYLLDHYGQPVPIGAAGEIHIGGAGVARGYLNQPELTSKHFVRDVFGGNPGARLYRTGDVGRWRRDGILEYLGRNDDQVKIRGFRIELSEIELRLTRHPQVKEAVVAAREDTAGEPRLVAYITRHGDSNPSAAALRAHLKTSLPEYMVPSAFVTLEALPLSPSGKLDRRGLPAPELGACTSEQYEAPQGDAERALAGIWRDLLRAPRVGRDDNFFELGGHSLSGMKLIAKVAEHCKVRLPPVAIFKYPTIRQMAEVVESMRAMSEDARNPGVVEFQEGVI